MPYLDVDQENSASVRLYYEDHGIGAPVVLIHGYPLNGGSWEKQLPVLLKAGHRVITYDRRGFGRSSQPAGGYHYDTFAADLRKLIEHLKLDNAALVGFSMGGGEVVRYIGKYGSKGIRAIASLGGIAPFLLKTPDNPEGVDGKVFEDLKAKIAKDRYAFFTEFFKGFYNADELLGSRVSKCAMKASWNVAAESSPIASYVCVDAWLEDFRPDVAKIDIPLLVMHGDKDHTVPIDASAKRLAKMVPGAKLRVIEGGPHPINWTHADEVNLELLAFL